MMAPPFTPMNPPTMLFEPLLETELGADVYELLIVPPMSCTPTKPPRMLFPPPVTAPLAQLMSITALGLDEFLKLQLPATRPPARLKSPTVTFPLAFELAMTPKPN